VHNDADLEHIRVLAGVASSGRPVFEVLPARRRAEDYEMCGSPGLAYGFAAGDRIWLHGDGSFDVVTRGGNLCLRLYPSLRPSDASVAALHGGQPAVSVPNRPRVRIFSRSSMASTVADRLCGFMLITTRPMCWFLPVPARLLDAEQGGQRCFELDRPLSRHSPGGSRRAHAR
jgi:hypothetical protein